LTSANEPATCVSMFSMVYSAGFTKVDSGRS
jgi:hypothetical protein